MKLRKNEMKLRKKQIKVPMNFLIPPWRIFSFYRGIFDFLEGLVRSLRFLKLLYKERGPPSREIPFRIKVYQKN